MRRLAVDFGGATTFGLAGDKICLPQSMLQTLMDSSDTRRHPLVFTISHGANCIYAGVREFTAIEGTVCLSPWIMKQLSIAGVDGAQVEVDVGLNEQCPVGVYAQLKPMESYGLAMEVYRSILEQHIRQNYTCLTRSCILDIETPARTISFQIMKLNSENAEDLDGVLVIDTDLAVDILQSDMAIVGNGKSVETILVNSLPFHVNDLNLKENDNRVFQVALASVTSQKKNLLIILDCLSGDADLFASFSSSSPAEIDCDYYNVDFGSKQLLIEIPSTDRPFVFVALRANQNCTTQLVISVDDNPVVKTENEISSESKAKSPGSDEVVCQTCKSCVSKSKYALHEAFCSRNNVYCDRCNSVFKKNQFEEHWHCNDCSKAFGNHGTIEYEKHRKYEHSPLTCKCGQKFTLSQLLQHRRLECEYRLITCRYCHVEMTAGPMSQSSKDLLLIGPLLTEHESQCGSRTVNCTKCKRPILIKDVTVHMKMHEMEKQYRPVPFTLCRNELCSNAVQSKNLLALCQSCFSPFWIPDIDPNNEKLIQRIVARYFSQFNDGCKWKRCWNPYCKTSLEFQTPEDDSPNSIALKAFELAGKSFIMPNFTGSNANDSKYYFCVDETSALNRHLADKKLVTMGYKVEWAIESLKKTFKSFNEFISNGQEESNDSDENDDEVEDEDNAENWEKYEVFRVEKAINWLLQNDII